MKYLKTYNDFLVTESIPFISSEIIQGLKQHNNRLDKSFVLNLNIPGVDLYKVPNIEHFELEGLGKFYGIKYNTKKGISFRISSKSDDFKTIEYFDVYDLEHLDPIKRYNNMNNANLDIITKMIKNEYGTLHENINDINDVLGQQSPLTPVMMILAPILIGLSISAIPMLIKRHKEREVYSSANLEKEAANFKKNSADENDFKVFSVLTNILDTLIQGKRNSLIINGKPGLGKTYLVKKYLLSKGFVEKRDFIVITGSTDLKSFYELLYKFRQKLIIFDDCDNLMDDPSFINILKGATDSTPRRVVTLKQREAGDRKLSQDEVNWDILPSVMEFTGKVVIITNLPGNEVNSALISRMGLYTVKIPLNEMLTRIELIMKNIRPDVSMEQKQEVFDYLKELYANNPHLDLDLRIFVYSIDDRASGIPNWKELVRSRVIFNKDL